MSYRLPNPASLTHDERMQYRAAQVGSRYNGSTPETLGDGSAIYTADDGSRFYLQAFAGKAVRACRRVSGYYRSVESPNLAIEQFKQSRASHHAAHLLRRQAATRPHTLQVGDVLNTSWGYEQTNVEFFQVVAVTGAMATLREIAASYTEAGFMSGKKTPHVGRFTGEPIRRRVGVSNTVKIDSSRRATPWDGRPQHVSSYA
ncbi:hypothetical protein P2A95_21620 [Xanthomonas perforans]